MNGEALREEQGYPLRAVVPGWEGNLWVKWLRRIEVGDQPWHTREETSKYTDLLADGRSRRFTYFMDAKSVVTNPSPQAPLKYKGQNVLSGLAWSGRGTIQRVDVSLDGGRNWRTARIDGPVLEASLTRFYVEFDWQGQELMIQSRAMDSTGYVQPTQGGAAQGARRQLDLPQQRHPDLARALERRDRECRSFVSSALAAALVDSAGDAGGGRQAGHRSRGHASGGRRLGYRRAPRRPRPAQGQRHRRAGRRGLPGPVRRLPRRVRRGQGSLAGASQAGSAR